LYQKAKASLHYKKRKYFSIGIGTKTRANKYTFNLKTKSTMKKIILLTTLAFVCMAVACVKKPPTPNCGQLPCPSATGANVVSCYVNGEPYIAKGGKPDLTGLGGFHIYFCKDNYLQLLEIWLQDSLKVGEFELNNANRADFTGAWFNIVTNDTTTGKLIITHLTASSVSGNFWFNATNGSATNPYKITEGNFDIAR
jgi:Family of unknown function (DUF6252)